ncbi:MAG: hypothetical protein J0H34_10555 [Rhizobiales bacterium]|nr:hypothetical protein [Hyphomicrobiales bacterium]
MFASCFSRVLTVAGLLALAGCASAPRHINDVCAVFEQNDGWFNDWQRTAYRTEKKYGIPVHVLMATVRKESGFKKNARPPRKWYFGFIPGKRASSAYGYSQALNGTWAQYVAESGNFGARRASFADALDFVGWYHSKTVAKYGVAPDDTFSLYLAYYSGWTSYGRGGWRGNTSLQKYARDTDDMARTYQRQLQTCGS